MYKLMMLITDNNVIVSCITAAIADILMGAMYFVTRPQTVTYIIIALEIFALEKVVRTKKTAYLIVLPLISLFLINWHCSMWFMMFVFALPYVFESLPIKIGKFRQTPCCSFVKLLICGIICFALGFVNPYGLKSITYIFYSFGIGAINHYISEMQPTDFSSLTGIVYLALLGGAGALIAILRKKNYAARFVLLFVGTLLLAAMNNKSVAYFILGGFPAMAFYLKDCDVKLKITESKRTKKGKTKIALMMSLIVIIAAVGCAWVIINPQTESVKEQDKKQNVYASLDEITEILDKSKEEVVLYTGFSYGQYMEFKGYHPYIDGRAELFLKNNNGEFDYLVEHVNMHSGRLYYKDVLNKYGFNYVIVEENELLLNTEMENDNDFEKIYDSESVDLYKLK